MNPRMVELNEPPSHDAAAVQPLALFLMEPGEITPPMAGGSQTYYATGTVEDVCWDPD